VSVIVLPFFDTTFCLTFSLHLCTTTILFIVKSMSDFDSDFPLFSMEVDDAKVNWKEVVHDELFVDGKQDSGYLPESNLGCHAKAELHLLRLLCGAVELRNGRNESTYAPILAHLMFCHRADHVNFPVGSLYGLSPPQSLPILKLRFNLRPYSHVALLSISISRSLSKYNTLLFILLRVWIGMSI